MFSNYKFDKVYTSDLHRCLQTTLEIIKFGEYKNEIIVAQILREKGGGVLEGKNFNYIDDTIKVNFFNRLNLNSKFYY